MVSFLHDCTWCVNCAINSTYIYGCLFPECHHGVVLTDSPGRTCFKIDTGHFSTPSELIHKEANQSVLKCEQAFSTVWIILTKLIDGRPKQQLQIQKRKLVTIPGQHYSHNGLKKYIYRIWSYAHVLVNARPVCTVQKFTISCNVLHPHLSISARILGYKILELN